MKRRFALFLAGMLVLSLTACGSGQAGAQNGSAVSASEANDAVSSPAPTRLAAEEPVTEEPAAEETAADTVLDSDEAYTELEERVEAETKTTLEGLSAEWEALSANVVDYSSYMAQEAEIESFYEKVSEISASLCIKMREYSIEYAEAVLVSGKPAEDMYDDLDGIYDLIYDDMGDDIYDGIYDGVLEDMYDGLYNGALDDIPEDVEYSDWLDTRSDAYEMWVDMRSDAYDQWCDFRSDVYGFWCDVRSEVYTEDVEGAQDEITDFIEDTDKLSGKLLQTVGAEPEATEESEAEPETETEREAEAETETQPEEPDEAAAPENGIRPEFKEAMDSYEAFFDEYIAFMESYKESSNDVGMTAKYFTMMQQYLETMDAMQKIEEEDLSDEEALYYAEVTLRISQKLLEVSE